MLAIVAAMDRELAGVRGLLSDQRRLSVESMSVVEGKLAGGNVITATTGMGRGKSREVVSYLSDNYKPDALVCLGYAGATSPELDVGDVVLLSRVRLLEGDTTKDNSMTPSDSSMSDSELLASARQVLESNAVPSHEGEGVTVSKIVGDPTIKSRLGQEFGVKAVDLESYWVASEARSKGIPFLSIRAITDPVDLRVPDAVTLVDERGKAFISRILVYLLKRPFDIYALLRLSRNARRATKNLTYFAVKFASSR